MPTFAVVFGNEVKELRVYPELPSCKLVGGLPTIRPFIEKTPSASQKRGGYVIFDDRVERELVSKTVDEFKAEKLSLLQEKRLSKSEQPIDFGGKLVPCDKEAIVLLMASQTYLKNKPNKKIKRAGLGELSGAQIDALIEAIGAQYDACFVNEADLYDAIVACTTVEQLDAIDIETGW
jgi:hypothetical protein